MQSHAEDKSIPLLRKARRAAGASQRSPVEEASSDSMDALFALNVEGTLRLNRVLLPHLLVQAEKEGGRCRIVVIGRMASQVPSSIPVLKELSVALGYQW